MPLNFIFNKLWLGWFLVVSKSRTDHTQCKRDKKKFSQWNILTVYVLEAGVSAMMAQAFTVTTPAELT